MKSSENVVAVSPWLALGEVTPLTVRALKRVLPSLAGADEHQLTSATLRPTLNRRSGYTLFAAVLPRYNQATRDLSLTGVFLFATPESLIALSHLRTRLEEAPAFTALGPAAPPNVRLGTLIEELFRSYRTTLAALSDDVAALAGRERRGGPSAERERTIVSRNLLDFQALLAGTLRPIRALLADEGLVARDHRHAIRLAADALVTKTRDLLDDLRPAVRPTRHAAVPTVLPDRFRRSLNRYLTFGGVVFAFVLSATTFGLGSRHRPLIEQPSLFWLLGSVLVFAVLGVLEYLRRKKLI